MRIAEAQRRYPAEIGFLPKPPSAASAWSRRGPFRQQAQGRSQAAKERPVAFALSGRTTETNFAARRFVCGLWPMPSPSPQSSAGQALPTPVLGWYPGRYVRRADDAGFPCPQAHFFTVLVFPDTVQVIPHVAARARAYR
jgi:hypothetical protein